MFRSFLLVVMATLSLALTGYGCIPKEESASDPNGQINADLTEDEQAEGVASFSDGTVLDRDQDGTGFVEEEERNAPLPAATSSPSPEETSSDPEEANPDVGGAPTVSGVDPTYTGPPELVGCIRPGNVFTTDFHLDVIVARGEPERYLQMYVEYVKVCYPDNVGKLTVTRSVSLGEALANNADMVVVVEGEVTQETVDIYGAAAVSNPDTNIYLSFVPDMDQYEPEDVWDMLNYIDPEAENLFVGVAPFQGNTDPEVGYSEIIVLTMKMTENWGAKE